MGVDPQVQSISYTALYVGQGEATVHVYSDTGCQVLYYTFVGGAGKHLGVALHPPPPPLKSKKGFTM